VYRVQQHLLLGGERYAKQNDARITASLPNVSFNGISAPGAILALKDVATFEGEDNPLLNFPGTISDWANGKRMIGR